MKNWIILLAGVMITLLSSCAQQGSLTGGTKDTKPPKMVEKKSTPNLQTNFIPQIIELTFDEWIKLEDVFNQVVFSPPLNQRPEVVLRGKTVQIKFPKDEPLKPNATYTINFGNAIKDITESNPAANMRFVFSTGAVIDSLVFRARVVDAQTAQPTEGVLLMLYDNTADSVVRKLKPFYFSRTDKNGVAKIENVRAGTFKVFALVDKDVNYLFNQDAEKIAFPDSLVNITPDFYSPADTLRGDSSRVMTLKLFEPRKKLQVLTKETDRFGSAKLIFNQDAQNISIKVEGLESYQKEVRKDSAVIFYNSETPFLIVAQLDTLTDTTRVRPKGRADFLKKGQLTTTSTFRNMPKHPTKPIYLSFNQPIVRIDTALIMLYDSAKKSVPLSLVKDPAIPRRVRLDAVWRENERYELLIQPNALTDMYGYKNDTILSSIAVMSKKDFGDIILTVNNLDSSKTYICQVVNSSGVEEAVFSIKNKKVFNQKLETYQPAEYTLRIIEDTNGNGVWDTGDYDKKQQPEYIFEQKIEVLRPNWELEVTIQYR